jgi:hypothetical protein
MKKLMFLVLLGLFMTSCSTDDNVPSVEYGLAPITDYDLPEFFEAGKSYDLKLTYQLPSTCHTFYSFDGGREDESSQEIFIYAITAKHLDATNCDTEDPDLTKEGTIRNFMVSANISEDEVFIFKLWTGKDAEGNPIFTDVEIPVGEPAAE